jgi:hypothetical protein
LRQIFRLANYLEIAMATEAVERVSPLRELRRQDFAWGEAGRYSVARRFDWSGVNTKALPKSLASFGG